MTEQEKRKMSGAKEWAFDNQVSEEQIIAAWNYAITAGNYIIKNLNSSNHEWWWLGDNTRLLNQLIERYGGKP